MTYRSVFSGCGGGDLGFDAAGMRCMGQCEIEPECIAVLERHWPKVERTTNITFFVKLLKHYLRTKDYAAIQRLRTDVISGGSPCQDLSMAGKRAGLDGERSGLFRDMVRLVKILQPKFVVWENVPGVLSSNEGRDFAAVIGYFTGLIPDVPAEGWGGAGFFKALPGMWNVAFRVLDSQFFGVPQRRRRVFLIGSFGDGSCCQILFESDSLSGDIAPRRKERQGTSQTPSGSFKAGSELSGTLDTKSCAASRGCQANESDFLAYVPAIARTLTAEHDGNYTVDGRGCEIISQNVETVGTLSPGAHPGGLNGQDAYSGQIILAPAVTSKWAKGSGGPAGDRAENKVLALIPCRSDVIAPLTTRPYGDNDGQEDKLIVSESLPTMVSNGDAHSGFRDAAGLVAFDTTNVTSKTNRSNPQSGGPCHTLAKGQHPPAIGIRSGNTSSNGCGISPELSHTLDSSAQRVMTPTACVRRLTPVECERLQFFPDNHTRYRADGSEVSDSARYRMIGNAWTSSVAEWIGRRLIKYGEVEREQIA